jgi:hypothetical protein
MRTMKDAGLDEVKQLKQRTVRSFAMERIGKSDCEYITKRLDEIHVRIIEMQETDPKGDDI